MAWVVSEITGIDCVAVSALIWRVAVPNKSWFFALRMYGPEQSWIDQTWQPGEIELVK